MELNLPCPLCGRQPMSLFGNQYGEQYYRCSHAKCWGSRDVEGSSFREIRGSRLGFERTDVNGVKTVLYREELGPTKLIEPIPGQPGLYRDPNEPHKIINIRDFYVNKNNGRLRRGKWYTDRFVIGSASPHEPDYVPSKLEALMHAMLAAEPQRTIARMFAIVDGDRELPRIEVNTRLAEASQDATPSTEMTKMSDEKKTTTARIMDQGKDIGSAMLDGLAEATVEEAGDVLLDMAKELFEGEALLTIFLATPDGRELVKSLMALVIDSAAVHTNIPKAGALRKLARYQFRSSARRVGGPRIKKVMKRFTKLVELSERLPELPGEQENVVDFATASAVKAAR